MAATAEKKQEDDHFGSESLWIPAGGAAREEEKSRGDSKRKRRSSQSRANLNGGELDRSHRRRGAPSQGQPKWWRAGQGAVPPR